MVAITKFERMSENSSTPSLVTNVSNDVPPEIIIQPKPQNGGCKKRITVLLSIICVLSLLAIILYFLHQQEKDRFERMKTDTDQMRRSTLDAMESILKIYNDNDEIRKNILKAVETYNAKNAKSPHIDEIDSNYDFENWMFFQEAPSIDYQQLQEYMGQSDSYEKDTTDIDSGSGQLDTTILTY